MISIERLRYDLTTPGKSVILSRRSGPPGLRIPACLSVEGRRNVLAPTIPPHRLLVVGRSLAGEHPARASAYWICFPPPTGGGPPPATACYSRHAAIVHQVPLALEIPAQVRAPRRGSSPGPGIRSRSGPPRRAGHLLADSGPKIRSAASDSPPALLTLPDARLVAGRRMRAARFTAGMPRGPGKLGRGSGPGCDRIRSYGSEIVLDNC